MARGLKFWVYEVEELYSGRAAINLRLYFRICKKKGFFHNAAHSVGGSSKDIITFDICRRIVKSHISDFRWTNRSIWRWKSVFMSGL